MQNGKTHKEEIDVEEGEFVDKNDSKTQHKDKSSKGQKSSREAQMGLEAAELLGYNVPEKESKAERKKEKKRSKTPERFEKSKKHKHKNSRERKRRSRSRDRSKSESRSRRKARSRSSSRKKHRKHREHREKKRDHSRSRSRSDRHRGRDKKTSRRDEEEEETPRRQMWSDSSSSRERYHRVKPPTTHQPKRSNEQPEVTNRESETRLHASGKGEKKESKIVEEKVIVVDKELKRLIEMELEGDQNKDEDDAEYERKVEEQLLRQDEVKREEERRIEEARRKRMELLAQLRAQEQEKNGEPQEEQPKQPEKQNESEQKPAAKPVEEAGKDADMKTEMKTEETEEIKEPEDDIEPQDAAAKEKIDLDSRKHDQDKENFDRLIEKMREKIHEEDDGAPEAEMELPKRERSKKAEEKPSKGFDMFADSPTDEITGGDAPGLNFPKVVSRYSDWDDEEGYYRIHIGEILHKKYKVISIAGKGVFGNVVKALNIENNQLVAIKILRADEIFLRAGERERSTLTLLNETDKADKRHILRLYDSFEHRKHLCMIFECMEMDLRECLKQFGKKVGLNIEWVRSYARQIFIGLSHIKKNKLIHCDLKPDNMLITNNKKTLKICDLGSAISSDENTITEYLQSRYYRAPEIILGCPYSNAIDIWSAAVTIFELYTGNFLFPGTSNNHMLKLMMQTKGRFGNKMLRKGEYVYKHFDAQNNFLSQETDPVTREKYVKTMTISEKPTRDIGAMLMAATTTKTPEEIKAVNNLKDLLEKCLTLDPNRRLTAEEALKHPFLDVRNRPFGK